MQAMDLLNKKDPVDSMLGGFDSEFGGLGAGDVAATPGSEFDGITNMLEQYMPSMTDEHGNQTYVGAALKKVMPALFNAAVRPQRQMQAPLGGSGHGVSANTQSLSEPFKEINQMTSTNPLGDLSKWEHLF